MQNLTSQEPARMEDWKREILNRDYLDYRCLISKISNILYSDIILAKDRESKLLEIEEMKRLKSVCEECSEKIRKELDGE